MCLSVRCVSAGLCASIGHFFPDSMTCHAAHKPSLWSILSAEDRPIERVHRVHKRPRSPTMRQTSESKWSHSLKNKPGYKSLTLASVNKVYTQQLHMLCSLCYKSHRGTAKHSTKPVKKPQGCLRCKLSVWCEFDSRGFYTSAKVSSNKLSLSASGYKLSKDRQSFLPSPVVLLILFGKYGQQQRSHQACALQKVFRPSSHNAEHLATCTSELWNTLWSMGVHIACKQHQRACTQIYMQMCLRVLCERGLIFIFLLLFAAPKAMPAHWKTWNQHGLGCQTVSWQWRFVLQVSMRFMSPQTHVSLYADCSPGSGFVFLFWTQTLQHLRRI